MLGLCQGERSGTSQERDLDNGGTWGCPYLSGFGGEQQMITFAKSSGAEKVICIVLMKASIGSSKAEMI